MALRNRHDVRLMFGARGGAKDAGDASVEGGRAEFAARAANSFIVRVYCLKIGSSAWIVAAVMPGFLSSARVLGDRRQVDFEDLRADLFGLGVERLARLGVELAGPELFARGLDRPLRRADRVGNVGRIDGERDTKAGTEGEGRLACVSFTPSLMICVAPLLSWSMPTETENA